MLRKEFVNKVDNWKGWSERILAIDITRGKEDKIRVIGVYGPNDDDTKVEKDKFWEELEEVTESSKGEIYTARDFNGRVGRRRNGAEKVIGKHAEITTNNNGDRLIDFCIVYNLTVTNTFYEHKDLHKYTRQKNQLQVKKSIIDYVLVEKQNRKLIKVVRVKTGADIYSDHFLLEAKIEILKTGNTENFVSLNLKSIILKYGSVHSSLKI